MKKPRTCDVLGCSAPHSGRGLCKHHYDQAFKEAAKIRAKRPINEANRKARVSKPEHKRYIKNWTYLKRYGIDLTQASAILERQQHKCAICNTKEPGGRGGFHLDHCHTTNSIRGFLCVKCNLGLGYFDHDPLRLAASSSYLKGHSD